jgi:hypothetical protein
MNDRETLLDSYKRFRHEHSAAAPERHLERIAAKARNPRASQMQFNEPTLWGWPEPPPLHRPPNANKTVYFEKFAPFTGGQPDPDQRIMSATGLVREAFGDPVRGQLSLGVSGGRVTDGGFGQATSTTYLDMPDRWLLGDAISANASIYEVIDVPKGTLANSLITVGAQFAWRPEEGQGRPISQWLDTCLTYAPGAASSAGSGFVGVTVTFELALTAVVNSEIVSSSSIVQNILSLGVNSQFPGNPPNGNTNEFLFRDWAFEPDPNRTIDLSVAAHAGSATQIVVEASALLIGLRAGVNDPAGGAINAAFAAVGEGTVVTGAEPSFFCPFAVNIISGHFVV